MTAREVVLGRVRAGNGGASSQEAAEAGWAVIPRGYRRSGGGGLVELLEDRLRDYGAQVVRAWEGEVAGVVRELLAGRERVVVAAGVREKWLLEGRGFVVDEGMPALALDGFEGVVTESTLAIAETGTIVLETVAGQGRRAVSLVPDYHLCFVQERDVVGTVPEAFAVLGRRRVFGTTFVSGPSATADIEMTRIKGVHGPRFLDVVLVME